MFLKSLDPVARPEDCRVFQRGPDGLFGQLVLLEKLKATEGEAALFTNAGTLVLPVAQRDSGLPESVLSEMERYARVLYAEDQEIACLYGKEMLRPFVTFERASTCPLHVPAFVVGTGWVEEAEAAQLDVIRDFGGVTEFFETLSGLAPFALYFEPREERAARTILRIAAEITKQCSHIDLCKTSDGCLILSSGLRVNC